MPLPLVPVIGGLTGIAGAIFGSKAKKAKRRAAAARKNIDKIQQFQAKRKFMNDFQSAQAAVLAQGALTGADLGSSAVMGQLASQKTQATTGMVELAEQERLGEVAGRYDAKAGKYEGYASVAGTIGKIAGLPGLSDKLNQVSIGSVIGPPPPPSPVGKGTKNGL
jgi:hypothetical protein